MDPEVVVNPADKAAVPRQFQQETQQNQRQQRPAAPTRKLTPPFFLTFIALTVIALGLLLQNFSTFTLPKTSLPKDLPDVKVNPTFSSSPSQTPFLQGETTQPDTMSTEQT